MSFCGVKVSGASHTRGPPWGGRFPGFRLFSAFRGRRFQVPFTLGHPYHKDWRPESRQPLHGRHPLRVGTPRSTAQKNCPVGLSWTPGVYSASHRKFCPQGYISIESAKPGAFFFAKETFPWNRGFYRNMPLRAKLSMRSGVKGGGWRWTVLFSPLNLVSSGFYRRCAMAATSSAEPTKRHALFGVGGNPRGLVIGFPPCRVESVGFPLYFWAPKACRFVDS